MNFSDEVKISAYGRWSSELLPEIGGIHRDLLDGKHHPCPRCGGKDRFRLIDEAEGAVLCNQCFNTKNGDGISAIQWMRGCNFREALTLVGDRLGIKARGRSTGGKRKKKTPDEVLRFEEWNDDAAQWCDVKGISREIVLEEGGRMAVYRDIGVIAVPIHGVTADGKPRGYAIFNRRGGTLPSMAGECKTKVADGSGAGWIGKASLGRLESAVVVWKVEGVTDMLALADAIPVEERQRHAVVSNAFGSTENPKANLLEIFRGKTVGVIHDPDEAGEKGAVKWATAIAPLAEDTRIIRLPGPGDLRDWLQSPDRSDPFGELKALARASKVIVATTTEKRPEGEQHREAAEDHNDLLEVEEEDDDHVRLAKIFVKQRAKRFLVQDGAPHSWQDGKWKRATSLSDLRAIVLRFIIQEFDRLAIEQAEMAKAKDEDPPKRKRIFAQLYNSVITMIKALGSMSAEIPYGSMLVRDEDGLVVDWKRRNMISFENGLLDLDHLMKHGSDGAMGDHTPNWWSLVHLPYSFDPTARIGPQWSDFLARNLAGDEKLIQCLQEWMGYCLIQDNDHHKFLLMIGEGSNGKSVFCAVLEAFLGEQNVSHVPLELFGQRFHLTPTLGKLANIATETHDVDKVAEGYLKQFTDGSTMFFDRKGLPGIDARPTAKLIIATNQPPRFTDKSMGLWRRMLIAPFTVEIKDIEKRLGLTRPEWWLERGELPGVFNWAIEGLHRLQTQAAFTVPEASEISKEEYRRDINPAREFVTEKYEASPGGWISKAAVYAGYKAFCEANGYRPLGSRSFAKEVVRAIPGTRSVRKGTRGTQTMAFSNLAERLETESDLGSSE